jgi:hypothetical protein
LKSLFREASTWRNTIKAISTPITAIPPKVTNHVVCFLLLGNIFLFLPLSLFDCLARIQ